VHTSIRHTFLDKNYAHAQTNEQENKLTNDESLKV